jgi:hypothetical protein
VLVEAHQAPFLDRRQAGPLGPVEEEGRGEHGRHHRADGLVEGIVDVAAAVGGVDGEEVGGLVGGERPAEGAAAELGDELLRALALPGGVGGDGRAGDQAADLVGGAGGQLLGGVQQAGGVAGGGHRPPDGEPGGVLIDAQVLAGGADA